MSFELHALARQGQAEPLRSALAALGANANAAVNAPDKKSLVPLAHALQARADVEIVNLLLKAGADPGVSVPDPWESSKTLLSLAISQGQIDCVETLLDAGADLHYRRGGYDAVLDAAHAHPLESSRRVELLDLLIRRGADVNGCSEWGERALLVLSRRGEFAAVARLLEAGAEALRLKWSPALRAIALDRDADAKDLASAAASALEHRDHEGRDALLLACAAGRIDVAKDLLALGADPDSRDRNGHPALLVAIQCGQGASARALLALGLREGLNDAGRKPALAMAAEQADAAAVRALLEAGATVDQGFTLKLSPEAESFSAKLLEDAVQGKPAWLQQLAGQLPEEVAQGLSELQALLEPAELEESLESTLAETFERPLRPETALSYALDGEVARLLLEAGADPQHLQAEARRSLLKLPADPRPDALDEVVACVFAQQRERSFGALNPEPMQREFWLAMIRGGQSAYHANQHFGASSFGGTPTWCAQRFGQSISFLPDGRIVQVGGEHEDGYDPDFCIYNDVFVHHPDGRIEILGYPEQEFPPTDFHTATLCGEEILIVGGLGYFGQRGYGSTPVYRLCTLSWRISTLPTGGEPPGWIHRHRARLEGRTLQVWEGQRLFLDSKGEEEQAPLEGVWLLDLDAATWRRG